MSAGRAAQMPTIVYVVLAAGGARRMGFAKATTPLAGVSPLARIAATLGNRPVTLVTAAQLRDGCADAMPDAKMLLNPAPDGGMTSSLRVANGAIDPGATLGVLLADKPFVTRATLERCESALDDGPACDVLYAAVAGEPGHPVYFTSRARRYLDGLPDGDTLRAVRENPSLRRRIVACDDPGVIADLDTPEAWHDAERRLMAADASARDSQPGSAARVDR
jgi:molybdenum cofactor cytidylyltransferase